MCVGPREWDLAKLARSIPLPLPARDEAFSDVLEGYGGGLVDTGALAACAVVNEIKDATWRLAEIDAGAGGLDQRQAVAARLVALTAGAGSSSGGTNTGK